MVQRSFPFDNSSVTELDWSKMASNWMETGVIHGELNQLQVFADSTGMQVKVKSGAAWIQGHYFESDAEETLAIGAADASNPRIDRVIARLDWAANTIQLAVLQGTPATSPVAPALTENTARWEIPLAKITVNAGAVTIASGNITDERIIVKNYPEVYMEANKTDLATIQPSTWTKIQGYGNQIAANRGNGTYATGTYKVPFEGVYLCTLIFYLENMATGKQIHAAVYRNGELRDANRINQRYTGGAGDGILVGSIVVDCAEADNLEFWVYQNDTVARSMNYAHMKIIKIS
jgi:hypothetical protein